MRCWQGFGPLTVNAGSTMKTECFQDRDLVYNTRHHAPSMRVDLVAPKDGAES